MDITNTPFYLYHPGSVEFRLYLGLNRYVCDEFQDPRVACSTTGKFLGEPDIVTCIVVVKHRLVAEVTSSACQSLVSIALYLIDLAYR